MRSISLFTLAGILLGFGLFLTAIFVSTDNYLMFFSISGFLMVVGGTLAAGMISFRGRYVTRALKDMAGIIIPQNINPQSLYAEVAMIIKWGISSQKGGIREMEESIEKTNIDDPFLKYGTDLLLSDYKSDELRVMMTDALETTFERNMVPSYVLRTMGNYAPAFGMIGTLIGMIIMLDNIGSDPTQIGQGLALALVTTLYGLLLSQLVFKPAAEKVKEKHEIMRFRNVMIMEGLIMLGENHFSTAIQDRLNSFLDPQFHFNIAEDKKRG